MQSTQCYERLEPWFCEAGCQWACAPIQIETSTLFLKLRFKCPTCHSEATRHYDLEKRGYVEAMGVNSAGSRNEGRFVETIPCFGKQHCLHGTVRRLVNLDAGAETCIERVAPAVSKKCPGMSAGDLRECFGRVFDIHPVDGPLLVQFTKAYRRNESTDETA